MRNLLVAFWMFVCTITSAAAQVSFGIEAPGISIGINMPVYPQLVQVPGYPVYYAPQANSNYFFYDGMYWVYQQDNWYASSWYNGPWALVSPEAVPYFILRVPVRYYRRPPAYFHGWASNAPPRWGEHWGNTWAQNRQGWDNWDRNSVPAPAPLPTYQRQYSGNKYPRAEQQQALQNQNYRYQPHEAVVQQQYQTQRVQTAPAVAPNSAVVPNVRVEAPATKAQQQHVEGQQKAQQQRRSCDSAKGSSSSKPRASRSAQQQQLPSNRRRSSNSSNRPRPNRRRSSNGSRVSRMLSTNNRNSSKPHPSRRRNSSLGKSRPRRRPSSKAAKRASKASGHGRFSHARYGEAAKCS